MKSLVSLFISESSSIIKDKAVNSKTLELISSGQFKLDFIPSFDVNRELEIKAKLNEKIELAKELEEDLYRSVIFILS